MCWILSSARLLISGGGQTKGEPRSSDLKQIGSAGVSRARTYWDFAVTVGIPFSRWGAAPFVVNPIPFPSDAAIRLQPVQRLVERPPQPHPFHLALRWRDELAGDPRLTQSRIAAREGISRARVTQVMNLLQLPSEIQADLLSPPAPLEIHAFSERGLRVLVSCQDEEDQVRQWRNLLGGMKGSPLV